MNVMGMCKRGVVDNAKVLRLIKVAEDKKVCVVAVQETWFNKRRHAHEMRQMLEGTLWSWYGRNRTRKRRREKKGSGGVGFLVHQCAGAVTAHRGRKDGIIWIDLEGADSTMQIVNTYMVPTGSTREQHNDDAVLEMERLFAGTLGDRTVVVGDWNGRIGEKSSFVFTGAERDFDGCVDLEEIEYPRSSVDKKSNAQGIQMLELMNEHGLVIANGLHEEMQHTQTGAVG